MSHPSCDAPTANEITLLVFKRPRDAFGFCIVTDRPIDNIVRGIKSAALLDGSFPLHGGRSGVNVIGTAGDVFQIFDRAKLAGGRILASHLLRDAEGQVPVYDMNNRGATGLPLRKESLVVPR